MKQVPRKVTRELSKLALLLGRVRQPPETALRPTVEYLMGPRVELKLQHFYQGRRGRAGFYGENLASRPSWGLVNTKHDVWEETFFTQQNDDVNHTVPSC